MKPEVSEIQEDFTLRDDNFLDIINEFALALLDQSTVDEVVKTVIDKAIDKLGFVDCVIYLWKVKDEILFQSAANGAKRSDDGEVNDAIFLNYGEGIVGSVAKSKQPRIVNDTSLDPNYVVDDANRLSEIAVPIIHNGNLLGVIDSEHPQRNFYNEHHLKILTTVASMASMKLVQAYNMEALEKRQRRLNQIYNSTNDLMFLVSVEQDSYRYISVNQTYMKLLEMKHSNLEGKTIKEVWKKATAERIRSRFKECMETGKTMSYIVKTETLNGKVVVQSRISPIFNDAGECVQIAGVARDITDQNKAEEDKSKLLEAVQRNEDKFRSLFENAPYPIMLLDEKHEFVDCNKAAIQILEVDNKQEIIGRKSWEFSPEYQPTGALSSEYSREMNKMAYRLGQHEYEWVDQRQDGSEMYIHVNLTKIDIDGEDRLLVHFQDVTQRIQAIKALRRSKERLRQIIDLVPHFIFAKDLEGKFILVNKAVAEAYGSTVKGLINKTDADFNDNLEEVEFFRQKDLEVIKGNKAQYNIEEIITNDKGERRTLSTTKIPFSESGNQKTAVLGVSVDITEEIKKQVKLEELLKVTSDQNERLQNFAHIISHNIRSHSSNISSLVNFIDRTDKVPEQKILLGMLKTSTEKLEETIVNLNEIIDVNKKLQKPSERRNLNREISNTLEILNTKIIGCQAIVQIDVPLDISIKVIPAYLDSILLNLITNAIKYRSNERPLKLNIKVEKQEACTVLEIADNGQGIDLERHGDKIFGMYKTFHTNEDSRGFGLYITKNQIEAMGGKIEVRSEVDKGATFKVYFYEEN